MPYQISAEACIGCTACAKLCPVFAIEGEQGEAHRINPLRCVSCGVCGRVCPKGAVEDNQGLVCAPIPRVRWRRPAVDAARCSACGLCVAVCAAGALEISSPRNRGDVQVFARLCAPEQCVGCGLCQWECPLGAVTMEGGAGL